MRSTSEDAVRVPTQTIHLDRSPPILSASILARLIDDLPRWHSAELQEQFLCRLIDIADHSHRDEREAIYLTFTRVKDSTLARSDTFFRSIARLKLLGNLLQEEDPCLQKLIRLVHGILLPRTKRRRMNGSMYQSSTLNQKGTTHA